MIKLLVPVEVKFLNKLGGKIKVSGRTITINESKIKNLSINHEIIFDRIEAGTYLVAAAITEGNLRIKDVFPSTIQTEINRFLNWLRNFPLFAPAVYRHQYRGL